MVNIIPFRGIRYNKEMIKDMNLIVTPPYDKIDSSLQEELYNRSPFNFVRLDKGREKDKYDSARRYLDSWLAEKVLIRDEEASFYMYSQEYEFEGQRKIRKGFIGLLELDEFENGNVLPHEHTLSGPKKDRFDLLIATEATFGQIFMLYSDPKDQIGQALNSIEKSVPDIEVHDDDANIHRVWRILDQSLINLITLEMKNKKVYIADGHHRYETSLNYRNKKRKEKGNFSGKELFNFTMCTFINMDDKEGMSILPTHRFIKNLENPNTEKLLDSLRKDFSITKIDSLNELSEEMNENKNKHVFGLIANKGNDFYMLKLNSNLNSYFPPNYSDELKNLDVLILHKVILEDRLGIDEEKLREQSHVKYFRDKDEAYNRLKQDEFQYGFLLNGTKIEDIKRVTESGEKMPQKSTDFYPKLLSGLVINSLLE